MKKSHFWDVYSFPAKVYIPLLLVFINFVFVFLLHFLIKASVGCLLGLFCPFVQFCGSGSVGLQVLVPPLCSSSRTHFTWRAVVLKRCE